MPGIPGGGIGIPGGGGGIPGGKLIVVYEVVDNGGGGCEQELRVDICHLTVVACLGLFAHQLSIVTA